MLFHGGRWREFEQTNTYYTGTGKTFQIITTFVDRVIDIGGIEQVESRHMAARRIESNDLTQEQMEQAFNAITNFDREAINQVMQF